MTANGPLLILDLRHHRSRGSEALWIRHERRAQEAAAWIRSKGTGAMLVCGGPGVGKTVFLDRLGEILRRKEPDVRQEWHAPHVEVELLSCHNVCEALVHVLRAFCGTLLGRTGDGSSTFIPKDAEATDIERLVEDVRLGRFIRSLQDAHDRSLHTVSQRLPGDTDAIEAPSRDPYAVSLQSRPYDTVTAEHELWHLLLNLRDWAADQPEVSKEEPKGNGKRKAQDKARALRVFFMINGLQRFPIDQATALLEALRRVIRLPETFFVFTAGLELHAEWRRRDRLEEGHPLRSIIERVEYLPALDVDDLVQLYLNEHRVDRPREVPADEVRAILCLAFRSGVQVQKFRQQLYDHSKPEESEREKGGGKEQAFRRLLLGPVQHWRFEDIHTRRYPLLRLICLLFIYLPNKLEEWERDLRRRFIYRLIAELDARKLKFSARDLFETKATAEIADAGRSSDAAILVADFLRILDLFSRFNESTGTGRISPKEFLEKLEDQVRFLDGEFELRNREQKLKFPFSAFKETAKEDDWDLPEDCIEIRGSYFKPNSWFYELCSPGGSNAPNPRQKLDRNPER